MQVRFCHEQFELPSAELGRLRRSEDLVGDLSALRDRLAEDGYLYLKGFLDRDQVLRAREAILNYMEAHEGLEPGSRPLDGVMGVSGKSVSMLGRAHITHHPAVKAVLESPRLFELYQRLLGEPVKTFDYKWLRAVGQEEATGCHMDHVYMGRGSKRVMTCWVPFDDVPVERGTLAMCPGSHAEEGFRKLRETYGKMDVDRDRIEGWFSMHPREITQRFGSTWLTDDVEAGDVITFGMHTMHASTTNTTDRWRLSCDVRFQPASESMDERWVGGSPVGHAASAEDPDAVTPMKEARAQWGV
ncbi:MAG: phytanoyl-CoA dioxygenase family protein [Planctomycetota bacterium]